MFGTARAKRASYRERASERCRNAIPHHGHLDQPLGHRARRAARRRSRRSDVNLYYGDFQAVEGRDDDDRAEQGDGADRLLRLRQDDLPALAQPHARADARRAASTATSASTARTSTARGIDPVAVRRLIGMVFQQPNPFPTMSIYDNVAAGLNFNAGKITQGRQGRGRRAPPARRPPLGRGQRPPRPARLRPLRRPAAAALHRPRDRGRARGAADGRALLGARPGGDAGDRGPDRRAEEGATRSRSSPTTCSRRRGPPTSPPSSTSRNRASPGAWSRSARPRRSSPNREQKATEDYVCGRFG